MAESNSVQKSTKPRLNKKYERELTFICSYMAEITNLSGLRIDEETDYFTSIQKLVEQNVSNLSSSLDDFFSLAVADPKFYEKTLVNANSRSPSGTDYKAFTGPKPFASFIKQVYGDEFMRSLPEMSRKRRQLILSGESILDVDDRDLRKVLSSLTVTDRRDIGRYLKYKILYLDRTIFTTELNFRRYGVELETYKDEMEALRQKRSFTIADKEEAKRRMFGLDSSINDNEKLVRDRLQNYMTYGGEIDQLIAIIEKLTAEKERFEGYLERLTWKYLKSYEAKLVEQRERLKQRILASKGDELLKLEFDEMNAALAGIESEVDEAMIDSDTRAEEKELDKYIEQLYSINLDNITDVTVMQNMVDQLVPDDFHGEFDAFYAKEANTAESEDEAVMSRNNLQYLKDSFKRWLTWIDPDTWVNVTLNTLRIIEHSDMYDGLFKAVLAQELSFEQKKKLLESQRVDIIQNQSIAAKPKARRVIVKPDAVRSYSHTASRVGNKTVNYYTHSRTGTAYVLQDKMTDGTLVLLEDVAPGALKQSGAYRPMTDSEIKAVDHQLDDLAAAMEAYKPDDVYKFGVSALVIIRQAIDDCFFSPHINPKDIVSNYKRLIQSYVDAEIQEELYDIVESPPFEEKDVPPFELETFELPFLGSLEDALADIRARYKPGRYVDNKEFTDYYQRHQSILRGAGYQDLADAEKEILLDPTPNILTQDAVLERENTEILARFKPIWDRNENARAEYERISAARKKENEDYAALVEANYPHQVEDAISAFGREQIAKIHEFEKKYLMTIDPEMYSIYKYNKNISPIDNVEALKKHIQDINKNISRSWGAEIAKFRRAYEQKTKRQLSEYERKYLKRGIVLDIPEYEYDKKLSPTENKRLQDEFDSSTRLLINAYEEWLKEIKVLIPYPKAQAIAKNRQFENLTKAVEACLNEIVYSSAKALGYDVEAGRGGRL